jgi:hypothetical protein
LRNLINKTTENALVSQEDVDESKRLMESSKKSLFDTVTNSKEE